MPTSLALDPRFVLWSAPEPQRAGRPLVLAMHGWSYDERHLFGFAQLFPAEVVVASVRAPYAEAGGYAWFPSSGNPIGNPQPRVANDAAGAVPRLAGHPAPCAVDWSSGVFPRRRDGPAADAPRSPGVSGMACSWLVLSSTTASPAMRFSPGSDRRFSGDVANVTRLSRGRRSPARSPGWRRTHLRRSPYTGGWGTTLPGAR